jgi:hypothetical protein
MRIKGGGTQLSSPSAAVTAGNAEHGRQSGAGQAFVGPDQITVVQSTDSEVD